MESQKNHKRGRNEFEEGGIYCQSSSFNDQAKRDQRGIKSRPEVESNWKNGFELTGMGKTVCDRENLKGLRSLKPSPQ